MDIILNAQSLTPHPTGIGRYTFEMVRRLGESPRIASVHTFSGATWKKGEAHSVSVPFTSRGADQARKMLRACARKIPMAYALKKSLERRGLERNAAGLASPIYHETNYVLASYSLPSVVTVHDLSHLLFPECHPLDRVRHLERNLPKTLDKADHIICVSGFIRDQLHGIMGVKPERITPVHLGVSPHMRPLPRTQVEAVLKKYALPENGYLLVVATREPRKNLERLVAAYLRVQGGMRPRLPLVFAGDRGWKSGKLERELRVLEGRGLVRRIGFVPEADLPGVYGGAKIFAFPSIYEGFGLPPLEAMACGVPVLASTTSAMSEVIADAGLLVDPLDEDAIASGLERLVGDELLRHTLIDKGTARAASFTWERCIEKTIDVYELVSRQT